MPNNFNDPSPDHETELEKDVIPNNDSNSKEALSPSTESDAMGGSEHQDEVENFWQELLYIVVMSLLLAFGIRWLIAEARYIPSESMLPTLEVNDRLIVEKVSYRFRDPQRGDIVVFKPTDGIKERQPDLKDALIKRIVGLPGDRIELIEGDVYINDEKMVEYYTYNDVVGYNLHLLTLDSPADVPNGLDELPQPVKELPDSGILPGIDDGAVVVAKIGTGYHIRVFDKIGQILLDTNDFTPNEALIDQLNAGFQAQASGQPFDDKASSGLIEAIAESLDYVHEIPDSDKHYEWGPEVIPEDSYLVLGDNRLNSYDGVFWGFLPDDKIIGRAAVRIWPLGRLGRIDAEDPIFEFQPE